MRFSVAATNLPPRIISSPGQSMHDSLIQTYLGRKSAAEIAPGFLAYLANLETVASVSAEVARSIVQELADQRRNIKLIASENLACEQERIPAARIQFHLVALGSPPVPGGSPPANDGPG